MAEPLLILGVTRQDDDPKAPISGLIHREGDKLKWGAVAVLFASEPPGAFYRLLAVPKGISQQRLERVEYSVSRVPRFLFKLSDGKLQHETLAEKLQFSEGNKALLKPQRLPVPLALATLVVEYLEVARLSDVMRREMLGGERSIGQLCEVLGLLPTDKVLSDLLWELARQGWLTVHDAGKPADGAIALNKPVPAFKK